MMFWIEIVATVFGFLCVLLTIRRNVWCWPTGLVQVLLFIAIFHHAKLYSDLILHVIYVGMQLYGWHCWTGRRAESQDGELIVSSLQRKTLALWVVLTIAGSAAWGFIMSEWTDASKPYGDAFTTVASLVAQYLLARKVLENWMFWIAVDVVAIGIYYYKSLFATSVLYTAFLVLAIVGFVSWRRRIHQQQMTSESP